MRLDRSGRKKPAAVRSQAKFGQEGKKEASSSSNLNQVRTGAKEKSGVVSEEG
ncbi:hypothetical protein ACFYKX_19485 [Cytobacillus sp. FJAT-54145]|uniref:YuzL family protein n=1 Tax=Cytobacillus spartinae TaxID=3299023 RepID=A0ABW6KEV2_9BACI